MTKTYVITKHSKNKEYKSSPGTIAELVDYYQYTLDVGASYQHEKGNQKINTTPKTISSLILNLHKAVNNSAQNGYSDIQFTVEEVK